MMKPWKIDWFVCRADPDDVKFAATEKRKINVGDELWRVPTQIGPIGTDHNHWAGYHLTGEPEEVVTAAYAPALKDTVEQINNIIFAKGAPLGSEDYFKIRTLCTDVLSAMAKEVKS